MKPVLSKPFLSAVLLCILTSVAYAVPKPAGTREVISLNANWRFLPEDKAVAELMDVDVKNWQKVDLPHTWNDKDAFDETPGFRRGANWYRRELVISPSLARKNLLLYFEGANQVAEVYVNGRPVGKHIGGYTAFGFDITGLVDLSKPNIIAVRVDNSFNEDIAPLTADFTFYGGIYRDVWLIAANNIHFKMDDMASSGLQVTTPDLSTDSGTVRIRGSVSKNLQSGGKVSVTTRLLDKNRREIGTISSDLVLSEPDTSFDHTIPAIKSPKLWSPDDPYLYSVESKINVSGKVVDTVIQPLGFRWFRFDSEKGFYLNDIPLKLRGTNRHQDYVGIGNALPDRLHVRDMELIKDTGFNFVRLAHYPQDPSVLEAADRLGLLIWEEIPLVNYITDSKAFADNSEMMLKEMIRQHRNHPSVILWGYMNEIFLRVPKGADHLYPATVKLARSLDAVARREDPSRLTTIAFHGSDIYNKTGLGDIPQVIGWNLYKGWYGGEFNEFGEYIDDQHKRFPGRPLMISEYGANADQRLHSAKPQRFDSTIEYQQMFHESYIAQIDARSYIAGSAIWSEFDFGSEYRGESIPHINQKGMFTYGREPKDVHFFYKASFSNEPVVHIAANDSKYRADVFGVQQTIDVYTNLSEIELICNGVSLGKVSVGASRKGSWSVRLKNGVNDITAVGTSRRGLVTDKAVINYQSITSNSADIAINVGSNASYTDSSNTTWIADQPYSKGQWGYTGEKTKTYPGDQSDPDILGTNDDPLFQTVLYGLTGYRLDVPDGEYLVELLFTDRKADGPNKRSFNVWANGHLVIEKLDLVDTFGRNSAVVKKLPVKSNGCINIEFTALLGDTVLSGIRVKRF